MSNPVVMIMVADRRLGHGGYHVAHLLKDVSIDGARALARGTRLLAFRNLPYPIDLKTAGIVRLKDLLSWAEQRNAYVDVSELVTDHYTPPYLPSLEITSNRNSEVYERLAAKILGHLKGEPSPADGTSGGDHG